MFKNSFHFFTVTWLKRAISSFPTAFFFLIDCRTNHFIKFNPLPDMPILGSTNSAANKNIVSKIWTNGDTII